VALTRKKNRVLCLEDIGKWTSVDIVEPADHPNNNIVVFNITAFTGITKVAQHLNEVSGSICSEKGGLTGR
jgi:hypothetical protein